MAKLQIPTGFEDFQERAKARREMAKAMMEASQDTSGISSWTQVLAKMLQSYVAGRDEKSADDLDQKYRNAVQLTSQTHNAAMQADIDAGMSNDKLFAKYGSDQYVQDKLKPIADAYANMLKQKTDIVDVPGLGYKTKGSQLDQGPNADMTKDVIPVGRDATGKIIWGVNPVKVAGSALSQTTPATPEAVGRLLNTTATAPSLGAPGGQPGAQPPSPTNVDVSRLTPEEQQILNNELQRRANGGGSYQQITPTNVPMGSPLTARPAPAGVAPNGKPYWLINGKAFDNPDGN